MTKSWWRIEHIVFMVLGVTPAYADKLMTRPKPPGWYEDLALRRNEEELD